MYRFTHAIIRLLWILLLDAFMSFVIFGSTAHFLAGPAWGMGAFFAGLVLLLPACVDVVRQQEGPWTVKPKPDIKICIREAPREMPIQDTRQRRLPSRWL